jgi:OPT oligopeptide transporter protein
MVVPEKSAIAAEEVEMVNYNRDEKHEAEDEDFNVWDGNPFPPIPGVSEYETRQLTVRSLVFGALIGCVAAASNVYLGLMIGWGFGAGMIAAMLGFAAVKSVSTKLPQRFGGGFFGPKENCSIQTSANAAASGSSIYVAAYCPTDLTV